MALSIATGLAHLHMDIMGTKGLMHDSLGNVYMLMDPFAINIESAHDFYFREVSRFKSSLHIITNNERILKQRRQH
jgi:hypothetical protein